jgi:hypothetical protein
MSSSLFEEQPFSCSDITNILGNFSYFTSFLLLLYKLPQIVAENKCVGSQFCTSRVLPGCKVKVSVVLHAFLEPLRKKDFPCLQVSKGHSQSSDYGLLLSTSMPPILYLSLHFFSNHIPI